MAAQPDISSILAALAAQRPGQTPTQAPSQAPGQPPSYQGYHTSPQTGPPGFALPRPTSTGSLDLSGVKPSNTGSVSIADAIAKARGIAAERGISQGSGRGSAGPRREDPRSMGSSYRRSRSRSRSPPRRGDNYRGDFNPYRDERRDDSRRDNAYGRRSRSPPPRGRGNFSPPPSRGYNRERSPDDNSEVILIDSSLVGLVIGRQGENLRRVEQDTGTRIQFGRENDGPQRQCRITGNLHSRMDAKREIYRIIDENGGNPPKETTPTGRQSVKAPPRPPATQQPPLRDGENNVQIMVPDKTVGLIIGRGGETIRDLQERSGCHVNILGETKSVNGLRPVNLIGTVQAANKAKEMIMEIVDSDTKNGGQGNLHLPGAGKVAEQSDSKITEQIFVPSEAVGMIIGKGGENIKEMQNSTGCKINVTQASGEDVEREIGLVGTRQAIEQAKTAIWEKVDTVISREKNNAGGNRRGGQSENDPYSDRYSQQQQNPYGYSQQGAPPGLPQQQHGAPAAADPNDDERYAAWGGYQNYVAMWYAALAQQQQGGAQQPGHAQGPTPGTS